LLQKYFEGDAVVNTINGSHKQLRIWCSCALLFWCALIAGFLYLFEKNEYNSAVVVGEEIARSNLKKDYTYRRWSASHGGVYVPVTDTTPPNPYLSHIPHRDVVTTQGEKLTLMNPAYMTRQVHELERELYGIRGHITSLNAIRPANKPDQWESNALQQFEQGAAEVSELVDIDNLPYIRLMVPMHIQDPCLKCHAAQGYSTGDLRGGISALVPMADLLKDTHQHLLLYRLSHLLIFLIGLTGLFLFYRQNSRQLTSRINSENKLQIQGDHLQGIVDNISSGIAVYDADNDGENFIIKSINPAGLKISKLKAEDVVGKAVTEAFPGIIEMGLIAVFQRVWKTGVPEHFPATVYSEKRISYWVENYVYKLPNGEIVAVYNDITQRKQAEDFILQKTEEWEKTFNAIPDIIILQNRDMVVTQANQAALDFFQMEPEKLLGSTCYQLFRGGTEPCPGCPGIATFDDHQKHSNVILHKSLDKVFHVCSAPVFDRNNEIQHFVYIAQDITEKKRLEEELFQSHKMEAIGTLAGGIAHDFNNILAAILGYAELAKTDLPINSPAIKDIDQVLIAGERATELVKQILTFSRKTTRHKQPLKLHLIVKEALKLIRASLPTTINIQSNIDQEHCLVLADPTSIHQIVVNLCTNALHAIGDNKGKLEVTLAPVFVEKQQIPTTAKSQTGPFVLLSVKDSGDGMDANTVARIFEPYFTTKKKGEGTGLGLALIHGIVEECNGFIKVESSPGEGTLIGIYLPAIEDTSPSIMYGEDSDPLPMGQENILFVDDEAAITEINKSVLSSLGYQVTVETKSMEALQKFKADPEAFDLVITDQTMPDLTGTELAKSMLKLNPNIPIILCTGYTASLSEDIVYGIGIKSLKTKPLSKRKLAEIVRRVLDENVKE